MFYFNLRHFPYRIAPSKMHFYLSAGIYLAGIAALLAGLLTPNPATAENQRRNGEVPMAMTISSAAFPADDNIPAVYTCDGRDISPPLRWSGIPEGTQSLVLIVDDPDAPDPKAPKMIWVHWVLYNIPPGTGGLPQGVVAGDLPAGTGEGINDWKRTGYGGPCPPIGRHRYFFKLYALDIILPDIGNPDKSILEKAIKGHVKARAELIGTYKRP